MSYMIAKQQNIITLEAIDQVENNFNAQQQLRLDMDALQKDRVDRNTYYNNQNIYTLVTNAYADARSKAKKAVSKFLASITRDTGNIYIYKVLIDKGSNTSLSNNVEDIREVYSTFNREVISTLKELNKKYKRSNKALTIQISNTSTEHAFRDKFNSILIHNHSLLVSNYPVTAKELEQIIANKLPSQFNIQVQEFNSYNSDEQLILNASNGNDPQVIKALNNYVTYIYKTVAQKPFKTIYELTNFENLPLEKRYNLIRVQQLITKGIRKHKTLTIKFTQAKELKISTKYLKYIPTRTYVKSSTLPAVSIKTKEPVERHRKPFKTVIAKVVTIYALITFNGSKRTCNPPDT